jgi:hypothetical protein
MPTDALPLPALNAFEAAAGMAASPAPRPSWG